MKTSRGPSSHRVSARALVALGLFGAALQYAHGQSQSLAFTGGILFNTHVHFQNVGSHPAAGSPGAATGGAVNRTYDNGFNRVDASGNAGDTTANWGYQNGGQRQGDSLLMTSASVAQSFDIEDAGDSFDASSNLEYRGSMGPVGASDWGILLGIGYGTMGAETSGVYVTDAETVEDRFSTTAIAADLFPAAPYQGTADGTGPRLGSVPTRSIRTLPGGRTLTERWEFDAEMITVTGGAYFETQVAGRLNAVVSAGILAIFMNADSKFYESSVIAGQPALVTTGAEGTNDILIGGFVQLALDWALWENASLVAGTRWQPTERFDHGVNGRTVEIDFISALAIHAGFSMRF